METGSQNASDNIQQRLKQPFPFAKIGPWTVQNVVNMLSLEGPSLYIGKGYFLF